mmetsp:Transcript_37767/g.106752  ORF Transcript_37767/g.106752 Transcript_37767/m.106752 type:complete len:242 (+) Transcript_37767:103-828(+)
MIISCKRPVTIEELLEPLRKRYRLDGPLLESEEDLVKDPDFAAAAAAAAGSLVDDRRRKLDDGQEPADKRLRTWCRASGDGPEAGAGGDGGGASSGCDREATIRHWAEAVIRELHGCPSVEAASQRCVRTLAQFEAEVRQAAFREATPAAHEPRQDEDDDAPLPNSDLQGLHHTNKVLMRAVHHLAERCRRFEANAAEVDTLKQALEQSQEARQRLAHSNEVLQGHLKLHLDTCRDGYPSF